MKAKQRPTADVLISESLDPRQNGQDEQHGRIAVAALRGLGFETSAAPMTESALGEQLEQFERRVARRSKYRDRVLWLLVDPRDDFGPAAPWVAMAARLATLGIVVKFAVYSPPETTAQAHDQDEDSLQRRGHLGHAVLKASAAAHHQGQRLALIEYDGPRGLETVLRCHSAGIAPNPGYPLGGKFKEDDHGLWILPVQTLGADSDGSTAQFFQDVVDANGDVELHGAQTLRATAFINALLVFDGSLTHEELLDRQALLESRHRNLLLGSPYRDWPASKLGYRARSYARSIRLIELRNESKQEMRWMVVADAANEHRVTIRSIHMEPDYKGGRLHQLVRYDVSVAGLSIPERRRFFTKVRKLGKKYGFVHSVRAIGRYQAAARDEWSDTGGVA